MSGIIVDGIKYVSLSASNHMKNKSLEDWVFNTLSDISCNGNSIQCTMCNNFKQKLTNSKSRHKYTNILYDYSTDFVESLLNFLSSFNKTNMFEFMKTNEHIEDLEEKYMKYDDWTTQLEELKTNLQELLKNYVMWEEEDIECARHIFKNMR